MAEAQPDETQDEAVAILRRLEPVLTRLDERLQSVEAEQHRLSERVSRLEGQVSQLPTVWTVAGLFAAINAVTVAVGGTLATVLS